MDAMNRVRNYLLDHVGHMTYPGIASFDSIAQRWLVPIHCRTPHGVVVIGNVVLDTENRILSAPGREELLLRLEAMA